MAGRRLSPMVFDFLWEELNLGEYPYPLRVPSHGDTMDERASLRHEVNRELVADRLKSASGALDPVLHEWLRLLASNKVSVDAMHIAADGEPPVAALAATDGERAVLAVQDAEGVALSAIYPDALVSAIVGLLPHAARGTAHSMTLPVDDALRTTPANVVVRDPRAPREEPEQPEQRGGLFGLLRKQPGPVAAAEVAAPRRRPLAERTSGDAKHDYALLATQPRLRGGQLAANARDAAGRKFRSPVLAWFDTVTGRYLSLIREGHNGAGWVTISGADAVTLRGRLSEMVADVSGRAH